MSNENINLSALKAQFAAHLESLQNLTPESFASMMAFIIELGEKIKWLAEKQDKTKEELILATLLRSEVKKFIGELSESQVAMRKQEWLDTEAHYQKLKEEAQDGDEAAKQALKDFEPVYLQMKEHLHADQEIDFPSSQSLKLLASLGDL